MWRPHGRHFEDDIFKLIFQDSNFRIFIQMLLWFVPNRPVNNNPITSSDNAFAPNRRHSIFWTNIDLIHERMNNLLGLYVLTDV